MNSTTPAATQDAPVSILSRVFSLWDGLPAAEIATCGPHRCFSETLSTIPRDGMGFIWRCNNQCEVLKFSPPEAPAAADCGPDRPRYHRLYCRHDNRPKAAAPIPCTPKSGDAARV